MLEEYKDILAATAGIATMSQMFSGLFICKDIYKAGSTKHFPSMPFVGGLIISVLFLQHGILLRDDALGIVNFVGIAINVGYILFFYIWSKPEERSAVLKQLAIGAAISSVLLGYVRIENPSVVTVRFGVIVSSFLFLLIAAPLFSIKTIIRTKNTDSIPFPMVVSGLIVGVLWLLYGLASHQDFIFYQNLTFLSLSIPQFILCLLYPSKKVKTT